MGYENGRIPVDVLVRRPARGKDFCLMMPGTAAKHDRLVALAQAEYGWTPEVSGPDDAYRTFAVQVAYKDRFGPDAAAPGESSHGGTFDGEQMGAVDYGNYADIGIDAFFDLARRAGFIAGHYMGQEGRRYEPWHVFDPTPWDIPATITPVSEEDEMKLSRWNSQHVFAVGREAIYHVPTMQEAGALETLYGKIQDVDNFGFQTLLLANGIHWDPVEGVLRGQAGGANGRYWSRLMAEGVAIRGVQQAQSKTLADVLAAAEKLKPTA